MSEELLLGKYKNTDELASAYKTLKNNYDSIAANKNKFVVPEEYFVGDDFKLVDGAILDKSRSNASKYGYTQSQFENDIKLNIADSESKSAVRKQLKESFDDMDALKEYVTDTLGLSDKVFNRMSKDDLTSIRSMREDSLNTNTNVGSSNTGAPIRVTKDDAYNMFAKMQDAKKSGDHMSFEYYLGQYKEITNRVGA